LLAGYIKKCKIKKIRIAFPQSISGTCANAKKYKGERKNENGIRNNLIEEDLIILL
jgi:hypothetical protein